MINTYGKQFHFILIMLVFVSTVLNAEGIDISQKKNISILEHASVYFDKERHTFNEIQKKDLFTPYSQPYINRGVSSETIWIIFDLKNDSTQDIEKILIVTSPLIEYIALYKNNLNDPLIKGVSHISPDHRTLSPYYHITIPAKTSKKYILEVRSTINPIDFGLWVHDEKSYQAEDQTQQFIDILLIGMVLALMLYSFILSFYTKDKSYRYYSFYLFALIYQQLTYLGLTQIYFPLSFVAIDIKITVFKITLLVITAALYSMYFLKTKSMQYLYKGYLVFIVISFIEMIVLSFPQFYNLDIVILTGTLFIIYNLWAGVISYRKGNKQARLFIVGFGIVFISYLFIILDALGFTSIMQDFRNILIVSTALEALILSLAFADRYIILQKEKRKKKSRCSYLRRVYP